MNMNIVERLCGNLWDIVVPCLDTVVSKQLRFRHYTAYNTTVKCTYTITYCGRILKKRNS